MLFSNIKKYFLLLALFCLGIQTGLCDKELYPLKETPTIAAKNVVTKLDDNGDQMVQLDIYTNINDLSFNGSSVRESRKEDFGYTVYVLDGTKEIEVGAKEGYLPIKLTFSPALKGGNRYTQSIASRETQGRLLFAWFDNSKMDVFIDNEFAGQTPFDKQVASGPHNISIYEPGTLEPVLEQQVIIDPSKDNNLGLLRPDQSKEVLIQVKTDPNALILIDNQLPTRSFNSNEFFAQQGTHDIIAIQPYTFTNGNITYSDTIGTMKRRDFKGKNTSVDLPLAGQLTLHKASTTFPNLRTVIVPKKGHFTSNNGTMMPKNRYVDIEQPIYPLLGEYELSFTADGYRDKKTTIMVETGQEATYTIKLDRAKPYIFVMYNAGINNYLGLEIAGCGKYFGWYGRIAGIGAYDIFDVDMNSSYGYSSSSSDDKVNLSFSGATGPMFTILRTRTWFYLQLGGGWMRKFYNSEMKDDEHPLHGWMAEASIVARTPKGFSFKVGYSYPFVDDKTYSMNIQNIQISLGYAF